MEGIEGAAARRLEVLNVLPSGPVVPALLEFLALRPITPHFIQTPQAPF
jgi:hypothetical protein